VKRVRQDQETGQRPAVLRLTEVRSTIAELVNRVHYRGERVIIRRSGKELAAVIPVRDLRLLEQLIEEAEDRIDVAEAKRIADEEPESIPWEDARRDLLKATVPGRDQAKRRARAAAPAGARPRQAHGRHRRAR
jgi:prevent-host-death family protein